MATTHVTLDRPRQVKYTVNALSDAQAALRRPLGEVFLNIRTLGLEDIRALLWAGLKTGDRRLGLEATGDLMDAYLERGGTLRDLVEAIDRALTQSGVFRAPADDADGGAEGNAPLPPAPEPGT